MNKIKYILSIVLVSLLIVGCDAEKASQDPSDIIGTDSYPTPSFSISSGSTTVNEGDETVITWDITFDKPSNRAIDFSFVQIGGDATEGEDFELGSATVQPFSTNGQISVTILNDEVIEATETVQLQVQSGPSLANKFLVNPNTQFPAPTITIQNFASDDFKIQLDWDATYLDADGDPHSLCDLDLDLEIYNEDFSGPIATSYSSCPEAITIPAGALPDGNYWLVPSFWTNAGAVPPAATVQIPAMVTFSKPGVAENTIDLTGTWDTTTGGNVQGNSDAYLVRYVLNIAGTSYTVTDLDAGEVVFQN